MGRTPCCEKVGLKKGPWTPEEDKKLIAYVEKHGHGNWRSVPVKAGLQRCGKSCRLRWINYLKPDIKRGNFSLEEDRTIIQLHALLGNKWSIIASHLPKRTDNEIKNYWNTNIKKRLIRMGFDPNTHKPKVNTFEAYGSVDHQSKDMNHMAQWESARLEAEARGSMFNVGSSSFFQFHHPQLIISKIPTQPSPSLLSDSLSTNNKHNNRVYNMYAITLCDLQLPVSTLNFPGNNKLPMVSTNAGKFTENENSLSHNCETDHEKIMEGYVSNNNMRLQDYDDIMMAVEAFGTSRCESIPELLNDCFERCEEEYGINGNNFPLLEHLNNLG